MRTTALICSALFVGACASAPTSTSETAPVDDVKVMLPTEVEWQQLNPARPASPKAGTLWGDRNSEGPTGFLLRPTDGFRSPPHIHNVSYRGVVIAGQLHNLDPKEADVWMGPGSFWTQPKGDVHITAARGSERLAYIEIDEGPYLVRPTEQAFASDDMLVNVDAAEIVWLNPTTAKADAAAPAQVAFLWGDANGDAPRGVFVKLVAGSSYRLSSSVSTLRAVVVAGLADPLGKSGQRLSPGGFLSSDAGQIAVKCASEQACTFYVRLQGKLTLTQLTAM